MATPIGPVSPGRLPRQTLRAAGATTANEVGSHKIVWQGYTHAIVIFNFTTVTMAVTEECDVFIQTTYDGGTNWHDVENIHFEDGSEVTGFRIAVLSLAMSSAVARTGSDATLADDTKLDIPLGSGLRVKHAFTNGGTINYTAEAHFR